MNSPFKVAALTRQWEQEPPTEPGTYLVAEADDDDATIEAVHTFLSADNVVCYGIWDHDGPVEEGPRVEAVSALRGVLWYGPILEPPTTRALSELAAIEPRRPS